MVMMALLPVLWMAGTLCVVLLGVLMTRWWGRDALTALFIALFVLSNLVAQKILVFWHLTVPGAVVLFSMTFVLTDMISEFYGAALARRTVWLGFAAQLVIIPAVSVVRAWPAAEFWPHAEAFNTVTAQTGRIVVASLTAYIIGQHHDVWAYDFWRRKTGGRHLWLRNNASTFVSQTLDSAIFVSIAFYGLMPLLPLIIGQVLAKWAIALIDTPFLYAGRAMFRHLHPLHEEPDS